MNRIFSDEKVYIDLDSPMVVDVSPYDTDYPVILLANGLKNRMAEAQTAVKEIYRAVEKQAPMFAQAKQALKK